MKSRSTLAIAAVVLLVAGSASAQAPAPPPAWSPGPGDVGSVRVPMVSEILDRREELGLSPSQVASLQRLGLDVLREAIRGQADAMIAQIDLIALLDVGPDQAVDVAKVEAKIREIERIRTELQLAMVRAVEAAKSVLTPDQRSKLTASMSAAVARPGDGASPDAGEAGIEARGAGASHPGGGSSRPQGPSGSHVTGPHAPTGPHVTPPHAGTGPHHPAPPHFGGGGFEHRHDFDRHPHGGVVVGPPFFWGDFYWSYPLPPAYSPPPPTYWYCPSFGAYYPYVTTCPEPWVPVPSA